MLKLVGMDPRETESAERDAEVHALFESLREHAFSVTESFRARLTDRLDEAEQQVLEDPESLSSLFISSLVQLSNLAFGVLRGSPAVAPPPSRQLDGEADNDDGTGKR